MLSAVLLVTGCSSFNKEWKAALKNPIPAQDITGPWEGRWMNEDESHGGKLRCLLTKIDQQTYRADFHAKYKRILSFGYSVQLKGTNSNGNFEFTGEEDLGKLAGGLYTYSGTITPERFFSTYKSSYETGTLKMERPKN
ncbi:MAG: hypothetical protein SFY81_15210 [Verrucomicrobiota bacterium]|nr:hypothetical protein [Verrucomicrobiota bacterium]